MTTGQDVLDALRGSGIRPHETDEPFIGSGEIDYQHIVGYLAPARSAVGDLPQFTPSRQAVRQAPAHRDPQ